MTACLVVGLTGGIGAGKSTVAALFAERGTPIIDADLIARDITDPDQPAFTAIAQHFGDRILKNGKLDRGQLRKIIFTQTAEKKWLEKLLHPLIKKEIKQRIKTVTAPYCLIVIPLLFEADFYSFLDRILVVDAPEAAQIERVTARDKVSKQQVEAIMMSQTDRNHRLSLADDVILNNNNLADLVPQVEKLHQFYLRKKHA